MVVKIFRHFAYYFVFFLFFTFLFCYIAIKINFNYQKKDVTQLKNRIKKAFIIFSTYLLFLELLFVRNFFFWKNIYFFLNFLFFLLTFPSLYFVSQFYFMCFYSEWCICQCSVIMFFFFLHKCVIHRVVHPEFAPSWIFHWCDFGRTTLYV